MPKKLFEAARFSRQGAFRACFYGTKRAVKIRGKTFLQEVVFSKCRQGVSQLS